MVLGTVAESSTILRHTAAAAAQPSHGLEGGRSTAYGQGALPGRMARADGRSQTSVSSGSPAGGGSSPAGLR